MLITPSVNHQGKCRVDGLFGWLSTNLEAYLKKTLGKVHNDPSSFFEFADEHMPNTIFMELPQTFNNDVHKVKLADGGIGMQHDYPFGTVSSTATIPASRSTTTSRGAMMWTASPAPCTPGTTR